MSNDQSSPKRRRRKGKPGKKTLLTTAFIRRAEKLASQGLNQRQIAAVLNVGAATISIWKGNGSKSSEKFAKAMERGRAKGVEKRLKVIEKAMDKSWQAAAWALERMNPDQFARRDNIRLSDAEGNKIESAATTVIAPTVVFVQPEKQKLPVIDVEALKQVANGNGHGLPSGNGKTT